MKKWTNEQMNKCEQMNKYEQMNKCEQMNKWTNEQIFHVETCKIYMRRNIIILPCKGIKSLKNWHIDQPIDCLVAAVAQAVSWTMIKWLSEQTFHNLFKSSLK